jgi:hypothetical protein
MHEEIKGRYQELKNIWGLKKNVLLLMHYFVRVTGI